MGAHITYQSPLDCPAWGKLAELQKKYASGFSTQASKRADVSFGFKSSVFDACGYRFDFSRNLASDEILEALYELADQMQVEDLQKKMFAGERINLSENRPVLHTALRRSPQGTSAFADSCAQIAQAERERMYEFVRDVHTGKATSVTNKPFKHIINIGIGGSDLGPAMAYQALESYADFGIDCHYVSNVDPYDLYSVLSKIDIEQTLVVIVSKTFTTLETMANARLLLAIMQDYYIDKGILEAGEDSLKEIISQQVIAVSSVKEKAIDFGIFPDRIFEMWDWVGGRYSVDSCVGISLALTLGCERFEEFIEGFRAMDTYFDETPARDNAIYLMALLNLWYVNFVGCQTHAILPYSQALEKLPAFLQQLTMESNGKSTLRDGSKRVQTKTGEIFWGSCGTNAQHAYFQLLHQGTELAPADFIAYRHTSVPECEDLKVQELIEKSHRLLLANFMAQTSALEQGRSSEDLEVEDCIKLARTFDGGRPTTTIMGDKLDPRSLGSLIAFYEHVTFVQGALWGINSFDQWGVELGKVMANDLAPALSQKEFVEGVTDARTKDLLEYYWKH